MLKSQKFFTVLLFVAICCMVSKKANAADPLLVLGMNTDGLTDSELLVEVNRTNTDFGLGGLSYDLQFSESLYLTREYSDYGWIANDGVFDISNPNDGSVPDWFTDIRFDTVKDPPSSEFLVDSSGIVELLTITLDDLTPRWIYFDLSAPSASDGIGQDLESTLGGAIDVTDTVVPPSGNPPEPGHTLAVYVPEPTTLLLFGFGSLILLKKRKT